jgi:hypothetical protein
VGPGGHYAGNHRKKSVGTFVEVQFGDNSIQLIFSTYHTAPGLVSLEPERRNIGSSGHQNYGTPSSNEGVTGGSAKLLDRPGFATYSASKFVELPHDASSTGSQF